MTSSLLAHRLEAYKHCRNSWCNSPPIFAPQCSSCSSLGHCAGALAPILDRAGALPATIARNGETFQSSHLYVAPLDHHLLVEALLAGQSKAIEVALGTAVRTMEERARMFTQLAHGRRERKQERLAQQFETQAAELTTHAQHIRQILLHSL
jgi:CheB methylesterase